jgi:hypothetical protein
MAQSRLAVHLTREACGIPRSQLSMFRLLHRRRGNRQAFCWKQLFLGLNKLAQPLEDVVGGLAPKLMLVGPKLRIDRTKRRERFAPMWHS